MRERQRAEIRRRRGSVHHHRLPHRFHPSIPRGARPGNASHYLGSTSYRDPPRAPRRRRQPTRQSRTRPRPDPRDRRHPARHQADQASHEASPPACALLPQVRDVAEPWDAGTRGSKGVRRARDASTHVNARARQYAPAHVHSTTATSQKTPATSSPQSCEQTATTHEPIQAASGGSHVRGGGKVRTCRWARCCSVAEFSSTPGGWRRRRSCRP